jgi:hypothetical protein
MDKRPRLAVFLSGGATTPDWSRRRWAASSRHCVGCRSVSSWRRIMENPGERLVGDYLRYIKNCDFVDFNVYTKKTQGEIDVVAANLSEKTAYICEVVTHLTVGIQYVRNARPDTSDRLIKKFIKDIEYGKQAFQDYDVRYMLWSPVVKHSKGKPEYNQFAHLKRMEEEVRSKTDVNVELVINEKYVDAIDALRHFARNQTKELKSPVMRILQIEEWARKNVGKTHPDQDSSVIKVSHTRATLGES